MKDIETYFCLTFFKMKVFSVVWKIFLLKQPKIFQEKICFSEKSFILNFQSFRFVTFIKMLTAEKL